MFHFFDSFLLVNSSENSASWNEWICAVSGSYCDSFKWNPTIDLNIKPSILAPEVFYLRHHVLHEFLPSKTWFYCHNQYFIDFLVFNQCFKLFCDLSFWFDAHSYLHSKISDNLASLFQALVMGFKMKGYAISACFLQLFKVMLGKCDHNMAVKVNVLYSFSESFDYWWTYSQIRYEMSIHDINMKTVCAITDDLFAFSL